MRLATLKKPLFMLTPAGGEVTAESGTIVQVVKDYIVPPWLYGYRLLAPGGLGSFVYKYELDNVVEFLANETG